MDALYNVQESVIRVPAAAVRARNSCFETQLATGRAKVWEYEASSVLLE